MMKKPTVTCEALYGQNKLDRALSVLYTELNLVESRYCVHQINIHEAKTQLSKLVEIASQGEEIIIAKAGKPVARLMPLENRAAMSRKPGALKGKIRLAKDFDEPMTEEELAQWNDAPIFPKR